jgi:hypothetical protein
LKSKTQIRWNACRQCNAGDCRRFGNRKKDREIPPVKIQKIRTSIEPVLNFGRFRGSIRLKPENSRQGQFPVIQYLRRDKRKNRNFQMPAFM